MMPLLLWLLLIINVSVAESSHFHDADRVSPQQLIAALNGLVSGVSKHPNIVKDYHQFLADQGIKEADLPYLDYVKVRMIFEATRDGGLWHLRWTITDLPPDGKAIWDQWSKNTGDHTITANAECDELSALFAQLLYHMGVRNIGLFWPTYNHTVAVWTVGKSRIVVPTSQIFLDENQSLGTNGFDPWTQKTIYEYRKLDVTKDLFLTVDLARFMMEEIERNIAKPAAELQQMRNQRVEKYGGS
jgi:hypothetical protein